MKKILAIGIVAMTIAARGGTFETDDGFTITLPDSWVEMPGYVVQYLNKQMTARYKELPPVSFAYGYQLDSSQKGAIAPYILVQLSDADPGNMDIFNQDDTLKSPLEQKFALSGGIFSDGASDVEIGEPMYESEHDMLWTSLSMDVNGVGPMKALVGVKRTQIGMIQLNGYAPADVFNDYEQCFKDAFANLEIDDSIRYVPQTSNNQQILQHSQRPSTAMVCIQAALVGSALWLAKMLIVNSVKSVARARLGHDQATLHLE